MGVVRRSAMALITRMLVPLLAAALCLLSVPASAEDMDERVVIDELVQEAVAAYATAATAARTVIDESTKNQPSKEERMQECVCAGRATVGDPCVEQSVDDAAEKKMRAEFQASCEQELAQMPGSMKETIMGQCIERRTQAAGLEYNDPKEAEATELGRTRIAEQCESEMKKDFAPKVLNIVEQPEDQLMTCICEKAGCMTDADREVFDEAIEDSTKKCKKTVAMEVAEAMGEDEEAEQPSREELAAKINECVCDSKREHGQPCRSESEWAERKNELKAIQAQCRKPLHDEL